MKEVPPENDAKGYLGSSYNNYTNHSQEYSDIPPIKEIEGEDFAQRYDTKKIFRGVNRHAVPIILSVILWAILGSLATWYYQTNYRAEAVVLYQEDLPRKLPGGLSMNILSLSTALDLVTLPVHMQGVKAVLGLDLPTKTLEKMIEVPIPRNNSHMIRILCKSDNPNLAIDIVNTLAKISVKSSIDFNQKQLQSELDNFKQQLEEVNRKLSGQLKEIENFKQTHNYFEMTADYATLLTAVTDARTQLQEATLRYNSLLVEYENLKRETEEMPAEIGGRPGDPYRGNPMRGRIMELQSSLIEAKARYAPSNPKLKILEEELSGLKQESKAEGEEDGLDHLMEPNLSREHLAMEVIRLQGKVRAAQKMKQDLTLSVATMEKETEKLPAEQIAFAKLLDAKKITEEQVQFLAQSVESLKLMLNVPKGSLELYQLAETARPLKDSLISKLLPILGLFAGFLFGLCWAVMLEMRDKRLWTQRQIEMAYTIQPIGTIPELAHLTKKDSESRSLFFMRGLAESLEHMAGHHPGALMVTFTSSMANEGKSFVTYQLAHYYMKVGKKVLLLEMDPRHNIYSQVVPRNPLEVYLRNPGNWRDLIISGVPDRIKLGTSDPYIKELVKSKAMSELMASVKEMYDLVLIDAPGVIEEDYAVNLAAMANLCIFIIGSSVVQKKSVDQSLQELDKYGVKPAGILLNRVMPLYIEDEKIRAEIQRKKVSWWQRLIFWR